MSAADAKLKAARRRLDRKLAAIPVAARATMAAEIDAAASQVVFAARTLVPKKSGRLASTIRKVAGEHELQTKVVAGGAATTKPVRNGADASYDYALGVEFGTQDTPPHPFFFPAYRLTKKRAKSRVRRAVSKAAREAAKS